MTRVWYLRDEIYRALHRWPVLLAFALLGCLVGWVASLVWPSYYRAAAQIYVGINPYRSLQDARFLAVSRPKYSNVDDYKNWQMSQLESAIYLEEILRETLTELQKNDPYWQDFKTSDIRTMLDTDWRSAGTWSLVGKHPEAQRAEQLSAAWSMVAQRRVVSAVEAAITTLMIDQEAQAISSELLETQLRREQLEAALSQLELWRQEAQQMPQNAPLPADLDWQLRSISSQLAEFSPAWMEVLNAQPQAGSLPPELIAWAEQVSRQIEIEAPALNERSGTLEQKRASLREAYSFETDNSLGLSPTLEILGLENRPAQAVRPTATLILLGGLSGFFGWLFYETIRISLLWSASPKPASPVNSEEQPE
jgi:hypothetical protein